MCKRIILVSFIFVLPVLALARTPTAKLSQLLANLHTMQANFTQTTRSKPPQQSSGTMALERPGKFYWQVTAPSKQLIVVNGKTSWIYYHDLAQAIKRKVDLHQPGSPAMLLSGSVAELQKMFTIAELEPGVFKLAPKQNGMMQSVILSFKNKVLDKIVMVDNLKQTTIFKFSGIKLNSPVPTRLFQFQAPKGVDVVTE